MNLFNLRKENIVYLCAMCLLPAEVFVRSRRFKKDHMGEIRRLHVCVTVLSLHWFMFVHLHIICRNFLSKQSIWSHHD